MAARPAIYDRIGVAYGERRHADPRIGRAIARALRGVETVLNVGAGTGSYEPSQTAVAVDVSRVMLRQRRPGAADAVQASAAHLPFADRSFAASLAILTVHHWPHLERGLAELDRVARDRVVLLTWDPDADDFWLTQDYFPEIGRIDRDIFPSMTQLRDAFGRVTIRSLPIPHDCADGFLGAYWARPHCYLSPETRAGMSTFGKIVNLEVGLAALREDLATGDWHRRHGHLLSQPELDVGYRLVVAERDIVEGRRA